MAPDESLKTLCHKCHAEMIYVTSLPHPKAPENMRRTTFVCRALQPNPQLFAVNTNGGSLRNRLRTHRSTVAVAAVLLVAPEAA